VQAAFELVYIEECSDEMKKNLMYLWQKIKEFFINPYWANWTVILLIFLSVLLNGLLWYIWWKKYQDLVGVVPISYSSAVLILNVFLSNLSYRKEALVNFVLLGTGLLVQIIYLIFLRFFAMSQTF